MRSNDAAVRIRRILFLAQSIFSAGYLGAVTLASIVGAALADNPVWAGVPAAALLLGAAASASLWGAAMDRFGRRGTLISGQILGSIGTALAVWATMVESMAAFLLAMLALGSAKASSDLGRYVAGEVHPPSYRARAIATVVLGATIGAVIGPLLVSPTGSFALGIGLKETAGPYLAASLALIITALVLFLGLRPEPRELARSIADQYSEFDTSGGIVKPWNSLRNPSALLASLTLVIAQMVMVMVMVITSLYMKDHGHELSAISLVISSHTFGMYAFSVVSGQLADRFGRRLIMLAGLVLLGLSSGLAGLSIRVLPLGLTLFGLGLGWNLCYVGGSTLLSDSLKAQERARVQGVTDTLVASASAVGSLGSGVVFAVLGYGTMGVIGAGISLVPALLIIKGLLADQPRNVDVIGQ